jgi:hypothetical protein
MSKSEPIYEILREPGVQVPEFSVVDAIQYILDVGLLVAALPGAMALGRHKTLAGNLIYVDHDQLDLARRDAVILLRAITSRSNEITDLTEFRQAVARLIMARKVLACLPTFKEILEMPRSRITPSE